MPNLKAFFDESQEITEKLDELKKQKKEIDEKIEKRIAPNCIDARKMQGKDYGTVSFVQEGFTVKHTIPKKVTWDNSKLAAIYKKIISNGDNPDAYIDVKYNIPEKKYSSFEKAIKGVFQPARTISFGKPTFKLIEEEK